MKSAISMYRAGDLILAQDCDYSSAKNLGLICPFCKSAVFWKTEHIRAVGSKLQLINATFSHYKTGTPEEMDCEKRSISKQGLEELERIKIESKNQRLKLFNNYLWKMIQRDRNISNHKIQTATKELGQRWFNNLTRMVRKDLSLSLDYYYNFSFDIIGQMAAKKLPKELPRDFPISPKDFTEEIEVQHEYYSSHNINFHNAICGEIIDFISTRSGGYALEKILKTLAFISLPFDKKNKQFNKPQTWAHGVVGFIAGTHWVDAIAEETLGKVG